MSKAEVPEKANAKNKPVVSYGPCYGIEVAVFENTIAVDGGSREVKVCAVSFSRNYREDGTWKKTKTLRVQDIPVLVRLLDKAYDFILERRNSRSSDPEGEEDIPY